MSFYKNMSFLTNLRKFPETRLIELYKWKNSIVKYNKSNKSNKSDTLDKSHKLDKSNKLDKLDKLDKSNNQLIKYIQPIEIK